MKIRPSLNWKTLLILAALPFVAAWLQGTSSDASGGNITTAGASSDTTVSTNIGASSTVQSAGASQTSPVTTPADLKLYGGTAEVVKLAQAGVDDQLILAYITNANVLFGVTPDQIVYLNDLGVPGTVVSAMMQHDVLAHASALATALGAPTNPPVPPTPGTDYANQPVPAPDDNGMTNPPPDSGGYADSGAPYPGNGPVADDADYFFDSLQPYGSWIYLTGYGNCWQPTVCVRDHAWRPYFDRGRWLYSDSGWYWQSDYSWGWAAFHYGRCFSDHQHGWVWQPNRVWAPAWVAWRQNDEYCGWAPLPPAAVFAPGIGFQFHHQTVAANFDFGLPVGMFAFIPIERFVDYAPSRYVVAPWQAESIFSQSSVLAGVTFHNQQVANLGMDPQQVDSVAGVAVRRAFIRQVPATDASGHVQPDHLGMRGGSLVIFRPQLPAPANRRWNRPSADGTSVNTPGAFSARTPTVLGAGNSSATPLQNGEDTTSHVRVYYVTHEEPKPATPVSWYTPGAAPTPAIRAPASGPYAPNSLVLVGSRNISNPEWTSLPNQSSSEVQTYRYHPGYVPTYAVEGGTPSQDQYQSAHSPRSEVIGGAASAGYQPNTGDPYHRAPLAAGAEPRYAAPDDNYRHSTYTPAPETTYRAAPEPRVTYSAPEPRQNYSAPEPRATYSAPEPRQSYSAPAPAPSYSSHSSSSSYSQSSSSGSSQKR